MTVKGDSEKKESSNSLRESRSFIDLNKGETDLRGDTAQQKPLLLQEDVRKSLMRDNSALLPLSSKPGEELLAPFKVTQNQDNPDLNIENQRKVMINSTSVDVLGQDHNPNGNTAKQTAQPFQLSQ